MNDNTINPVQLPVRRRKLYGKIARVLIEITVDPRFARSDSYVHTASGYNLKPRRRDGENSVPDERSEVFRPIFRFVRPIVRNAIEKT